MFSRPFIPFVASVLRKLGDLPANLCAPGSEGLQCGRSQGSKDGAELNGLNSQGLVLGRPVVQGDGPLVDGPNPVAMNLGFLFKP